MNALQALQALQAATERRAIPKTTRRHVHLSPRPLVVVGYHLAGDLGAPLALLWGTTPDVEPRCIVVPEPRNRSLRFNVLDLFAAEFVAYLAGFEDRDVDDICVDAPQLVVPNAATADWLTGIVGRFTRNLRTDGDSPAPPSVPLAGKHLSFFGDLLPGSSLVLAATDALTTHWQTGQLPAEDLNLAALLGWIDPPEGLDGSQAARVGEGLPPAGPESDPNWDAQVLAELISDWHAADDDQAAQSDVRIELELEVRRQLTPAWEGCWRALDLLGALRAGDHVASRWQSDCVGWTGHCNRIAGDRAHFRNIPTPVQGATRLRFIEERTESLQREMAWDDPLVMAGLVANGDALSGRVLIADRDRRIRVNGRRTLRPLITIDPAVEFTRPAGTTLFLSTSPKVQLQVLPADASGLIRAEVLRGANRNDTIDRLPNPGDEVVLSPFGAPEFYQQSPIDDIPWTHQQVIDDDPGGPE